jgi:hypothetical protein
MTGAAIIRRAAWSFAAALVLATLGRAAENPDTPPEIVTVNAAGHLQYGADARGNRIMDFSMAGFGGGAAIPRVTPKIRVAPSGEADERRIQAALDAVAALPMGPDGFRGAVLLEAGTFKVEGSLRLTASGVVLRGSGDRESGTTIVAVGQSRRPLIRVEGEGVRRLEEAAVNVNDAYVAVGSLRLHVKKEGGLSAGARVVVHRPSTQQWISALGMDLFPGWLPENRVQWGVGSRDLDWDRTVVAVNGDELVLDAPITTALDRDYGVASVRRYEFPGRISHVGVENLRCVSEYDSTYAQDEEHAWECVVIDKAEDAWVRQLSGAHFVDAVVLVGPDARAVTVEDCRALEPVSEKAAYRRRSFFVSGQLVLVQRCTSERSLHAFATGFAATGPIVFHQCSATEALDWSGTTESWASGVLFDNTIVRGNALRLMNVGARGQGAGWTAANCILWNCESTEIQVQSPPGALNQEFGCRGVVVDDSLRYDPRWMPYTDPQAMPFRSFFKAYETRPQSLFEAQVDDRVGADAVRCMVPTAIDTSPRGSRLLADRDVPPPEPEAPRHPLTVANGRFLIDGAPGWTAVQGWSWYRGEMAPKLASQYGPAITRFAPGEEGLGLTDDLREVVKALPPGTVFQQHYGLWYDRRRINHDYYGWPEMTADDVSPPFMEMPWARSGKGSDWDGLSRFDLSRFNPWYFGRVREFAALCAEQGRVLYCNFYLQHALLEVHAHYADFPWRPANCIQSTGLPDEYPAANVFYDVSDPLRRQLHRAYLRHTLDVLRGQPNVVFGIDPEYSGPLPFVQFVLDTIREWERENDARVYVALDIPKAEVDAILNDPVRGPMVTAVSHHKWFYRADGSLYAVIGGINVSPRGQTHNIVPDSDLKQLRIRLNKPEYNGPWIAGAPEFVALSEQIQKSSPTMRYRAWCENRLPHSSLVILDAADDFPALTASLEKAIPDTVREALRRSDLTVNPTTDGWVLLGNGANALAFVGAPGGARVSGAGSFGFAQVRWIDSTQVLPPQPLETNGADLVLRPPAHAAGGAWFAWLTR